MDFTEDMGRAMRELTDKGAFLSVKSARGVNTMTVSWGFIGMIWAKPHFIALVRPQRHTKKILEKADSFTVSIPYGVGFKERLAVCGSESGADTDKSAIVESIIALVGRYPANELTGRGPIPLRLGFPAAPMRGRRSIRY